MFMGGELVLKLPKEEVDNLVASGAGVRSDAGKGRAMKEWVVVSARASRSWPKLAQRALTFIGSAPK